MPAKHPTILITAGEPSGDRLGAALMRALQTTRSKPKFIGVGGPEMQAAGLNSLFPMSDLSVMGLLEVIPAIPRILCHLRQLTKLAQQQKPDLTITIDSQDFSTRLAKRLKPLGIPHLHYVAPKVWAWRQGRALKLKTLYTHLLTILPFEEKFFENIGLPTTYVGHPAIALATQTAPSNLTTPILALLPGSRGTEIKRHWPLFLQTYRNLRAQVPTLSGTLILPEDRHLKLCEEAHPWEKSDNLTVIVGNARFAALSTATAALTKSGTNNLEVALLGTPAVVSYKMNALTHLIAQRLIKVPFISLPNLILHYAGQKEAYPELIQSAATVTTLQNLLLPLLQNKPAATAQRTRLKALHKLMLTPKPPALMAAEVVSKYLK